MKKSSKAFTLVETIVVIALISIISAIIIPNMDVYERYCLKAASQQLKSDIMFIQDITINSEHEAQLKFVKDNTYRIYVGEKIPWKKTTLPGIKEITYDRNDNLIFSNIEFTLEGITKRGARSIKLFTQKYFLEITITLGSGAVRISEIQKRY